MKEFRFSARPCEDFRASGRGLVALSLLLVASTLLSGIALRSARTVGEGEMSRAVSAVVEYLDGTRADGAVEVDADVLP